MPKGWLCVMGRGLTHGRKECRDTFKREFLWL
jgi:hypothetical protein